MIFKRKIYEKMLQWKQTENGRTALLIKGARRIGKSTIAKEFATREYESHIIVDFADAPAAVWEAVSNIADRDNFFMQLQFIYGVRLIERKSVIIFDEVQRCPAVRQAIKYLVADGRYDYIETGSLLSIRKNTKDIVIPSEETRLTMYPMDYEEFMWALNKGAVIDLMRDCFVNLKPPGDAVTRQLMRDFRLYMLVGGMPQAVDAYIETLDLSLVDRRKRQIIDLYLDDFEKIDPSGKASLIFKSIPAQLSSNANRYIASRAVGGSVANENFQYLLREMEDSLTINIAHHVNDPNVGMTMTADYYDRYKIYLADTGLFITLAFMDKEVTDNIIYQKLLSDKLSSNIGYVYENVMAQVFTASGHKLFYFTWPTPSGKHNYEIDFILSSGDKICPVEVKSSGYKAHTSLDDFIRKFHERIRTAYLVYTKDLRKDDKIILLPAFLSIFL